MKNYLISWIFFIAGAILEEWSQCVKSMGVSSRESWAYRLTDGTSSYWQSCGTQGKHWIRLELHPDVLIHSLRIQVSRVPFMMKKLSHQNDTLNFYRSILPTPRICPPSSWSTAATPCPPWRRSSPWTSPPPIASSVCCPIWRYYLGVRPIFVSKDIMKLILAFTYNRATNLDKPFNIIKTSILSQPFGYLKICDITRIPFYFQGLCSIHWNCHKAMSERRHWLQNSRPSRGWT